MSLDWGSWSDRFRWRVSRRGNVVELWATPGAIGDQAARLTGEPIRALTIENADVAGVAAISLREPFRNLRQLSVEANGLSGDLVATLVERRSRFTMLVKVAGKDAESVGGALKRQVA